MAAEPQELFPSERREERTGIHRCTRCLTSVDSATYFALDTLCARCDAQEGHPDAGSGQPNSYTPYDRPEVREAIGRRGMRT